MMKQKMRLTALLLLLGCVPVLLFSVFSYTSIARPLADKHAAYQRQILTQNQNAVERLLWNVSVSTDAFIQSGSRQQAMLLDMSGHDFQTFRQVVRELARLQPYDAMQADACLISLKCGWIINNSGLYRLNESEHADKYQMYIDADAVSGWITHFPDSVDSQQKIYDSFFSGASVNFIATIPVGTRQNAAGLVMIKLPLEYLSQQLNAGANVNEMLILDQNLRIIADAHGTRLGEEFLLDDPLREMIADVDSDGTFSANSRSAGAIDLLVQRSSYNGWYYILSAPKSEMASEYSAVGIAISAICGGCLLILFFCSFFVSRTTYKPVMTLAAELAQGEDELLGKDAFSYIGRRIGDMQKNQSLLEEEVTAQMQAVQEYTTVSILLGDLDEAMIAKQVRLFDAVPADWRKAVLVMQSSLEENAASIQGAGMLMTTILREITETFANEYIFLPVIISQSLVMVVSGEQEHEAAFCGYITSIASRLQGLLGKYTSVDFGIGVGRVFTHLEDTSYSYIEAVNALEHRILAGNKTIIFYKDMTPTRNIHPQVYQRTQSRLLAAIRIADAEKAAQYLSVLFHDVLGDGLSHNEFTAPLLGTLLELIVIHEEIGLPLPQAQNDSNSLYDRLLAHKTREDMQRWLWEQMIEPCILQIRKSHDSQYHHVAKAVRDMIENQFDQDITVESCAEALNYHPAHIRRVFLEITGENFGQYLNYIRMEAAKQWLHTTDMMVQEIAVKLRYSNSQNFIRNFRLYTGYTPGAYRKMNQKNQP